MTKNCFFVTGNIATDVVYVNNNQVCSVPGGTALRVGSVIASFGVDKGYLFGTVARGIGEDFKKSIESLRRGGIEAGKDSIWTLPVGMSFTSKYRTINKSKFKLVGLEGNYDQLQSIPSIAFQSYVEKVHLDTLGDYRLVLYVCPMPTVWQERCLDVARKMRSFDLVILTTHNNLINDMERKVEFINNLRRADVLSINEIEGRVLVGTNENLINGRELSKMVDGSNGIVIITSEEKGSYVFQSGKPKLYLNPKYRGNVVNPTGAGDVFTSSFIMGLINRDWDIYNVGVMVEALVDAQILTEYAISQPEGYGGGVKAVDLIKNKEVRRGELMRLLKVY